MTLKWDGGDCRKLTEEKEPQRNDKNRSVERTLRETVHHELFEGCFILQFSIQAFIHLKIYLNSVKIRSLFPLADSSHTNFILQCFLTFYPLLAKFLYFTFLVSLISIIMTVNGCRAAVVVNFFAFVLNFFFLAFKEANWWIDFNFSELLRLKVLFILHNSKKWKIIFRYGINWRLLY